MKKDRSVLDSPYTWLIILASAIYLWGIKRNLPFAPEGDEQFYWVERAVNMVATKSLNPQWFGHPSSTTLYPLTLIYWLIGGSNVQQSFSNNPPLFFLIGRFLTALYAILTVPVVYSLGKRVFNQQVAIVGTIFFIFYDQVVFYAQMVRSDSAATFFGMLALLGMVRFYDQARLKYALWIGISLGLAMSSRYFMAVFGLSFGILLLFMPQIKWSAKLWWVCLVGLLTILTFALTTPYFFLDWQTAQKSLQTESGQNHLGVDQLSRWENFWWYLIVALPRTITWLQVVLFGVACSVVLLKRQALQRWFMTNPWLFLVIISLPGLHWQRWIIQMLPLVALLVAEVIRFSVETIVKRFAKNNAYITTIVVMVSLLVTAPLIFRTLTQNMRNSSDSTRILSRYWIQKELDPSSLIVQEAYTSILTNTGYKTTESFALPFLGQTVSQLGQNYDYAIVSSAIYNRYFENPPRYAKEIAFYQELFDTKPMIFQMKPSTLRGGSEIRIYKLR